jgi:putative redox protein
MYAEQQGIQLSGVTTRVKLDRSKPEETVFEYEVDLQGELTDTDRDRLITVAEKCPVRQTLSKHLGFRTK